MKFRNLKFFGLTVFINLIPLPILAGLGCKGEECMIVVMLFGNGLLWTLAYIPYLFIGVKALNI